MNFPLVSIITVVYNGGETLLDTINSVANQTYKNIEYIIIDGLSTDNTLDIVKNNSEKITTIISEPDKGLYDAMNKGIAIANGDIVGIINSDDWYEPKAVEIAVNAFMKNPNIEIIHGNMNFFYSNDKFKVLKPLGGMGRMRLIGMSFFHPTFFVKKSVYDKFKFDLRFKILSDYDFVMRTIIFGKKYLHVDRVITNMRSGGVSSAFIERIKEGHKIRVNLGMSLPYVYLSSTLRIALTVLHKIKSFLYQG